MTFFRGNASITNGSITNAKMQASQITDSSLDMNNQNITSVLDPVQDQDAATKHYVDTRVSSAGQFYSVELTGTTYSDITNPDPGAYQIYVSMGPYGSSTAIFMTCKSDATKHGSVARIISSPATTGEMLELLWPPNDYIKVRKTGTDNDGPYQIKIL